MTKLTPKQDRFVREYLIDLNATQAAIRAGYSPRTANEIGAMLTAKPHVRAAIDLAKDARAEILSVDGDRVLAEIACMAFYDPANLMVDGEPDEDDPKATVVGGRVIYGLRHVADIKRLPEDVRRAIVGWGWDRNGNFTVKLADKSKALDQLARHLSLYVDRMEVVDLSGLASRLAAAKRRLDEDAPSVAT